MPKLSRFFASIGVAQSKSTSFTSVSVIFDQMLPASRKRPAVCSMTTNCNDDETEAITSQHQRRRQQLTYRPLVIVIAGPTAVGKSDVAALLCSETFASSISRGHRLANAHYNEFNNNDDDDEDDEDYTSHSNSNEQCQTHHDILMRGNVISADSVQVYRNANIGSNKPTKREMEITPHHLIDIINIDIPGMYNAADWTEDACYVIRKLSPPPPPPLELDGDDNQRSDNDEGGDNNNIGDNKHDDVKVAAVQMRRKCIDGALEQQQSTAILPVVVGGTMMYLQWLVHGRPDAVRPTIDAVQRAADMIDAFRNTTTTTAGNTHGNEEDADVNNKVGMNDANEDHGDDFVILSAITKQDIASWDVASKFVKSLGPLFARRVTKLPGRDWYRLRRLLEVAYTMSSSKMAKEFESIGDGTSGMRMTVYEREKKILSNLTEEEAYTGLRTDSLSDLGYDVRCFFLCPADRMTHFHVVDDRCERMVMSGLLDETANMCISGALTTESQITRAIGYRQALQYLRREGARRNDIEALTAFMDEFMSATRQYAKKQMQWFRRDDEFAFIPIQMNDAKDIRVRNAANIIADLCQLRRDDFDMELRSSSTLRPSSDDADDFTNKRDEERQPSFSIQTKIDNERQGKTMKFFISKRIHLVHGMAEFTRILSEADRCTCLVQGSIEDEAM